MAPVLATTLPELRCASLVVGIHAGLWIIAERASITLKAVILHYDDWKRFPVDLLATFIFNVAAALILLPLSVKSHYVLIAWAALPALDLLILLERKNMDHPDFPDRWPKRSITPYGSALALFHVILVITLWMSQKTYIGALLWLLERIYG